MIANEEELLKTLRPNEGAKFSRQTVTNTPLALGSSGSIRRLLTIYHASSGSLYIGTASVNTATGFKVPGSVITQIPVGENIIVFGFADASTDVHIGEYW